jgi:hypothetical protein
MRLDFHPEAAFELVEAAAGYDAGLAGPGWRFAAERATELLIRHPMLGARIEGESRGFALSRLAYTVVDPAKTEFLTVLAVANQYRRPGYRRDRLAP